MEPWERRYEHYQDVRDSQCESLGIPIPEEEYGVIHVIKGLWRKFEGKKFWKSLENRGHDKMSFEECRCSHDK